MIQFEQLYKQVLPVLQSKMSEIQYYEYDGITLEDIWHYCVQKKWRKKRIEELHLYEIVETIYSIKASEIVSYFQIQQFQSANWFSDVSQDELKVLFKSKNLEHDS